MNRTGLSPRRNTGAHGGNQAVAQMAGRGSNAATMACGTHATAGVWGFWKGPVATTTRFASIWPAEGSTKNPGFPVWRVAEVTLTPQRMGALILRA
jgi:hypothetical protein